MLPLAVEANLHIVSQRFHIISHIYRLLGRTFRKEFDIVMIRFKVVASVPTRHPFYENNIFHPYAPKGVYNRPVHSHARYLSVRALYALKAHIYLLLTPTC